MDTRTGLAPLGPEDTNGAIWSNGNIPAASLLEYRATYRNGIDVYRIFTPARPSLHPALLSNNASSSKAVKVQGMVFI